MIVELNDNNVMNIYIIPSSKPSVKSLLVTKENDSFNINKKLVDLDSNTKNLFVINAKITPAIQAIILAINTSMCSIKSQ